VATAKAGLQVRDRAAEAASVRLLSHAAKAKKPSPSRAAVTSLTTRANPISIAKMQTVKQLRLDNRGLIVLAAIVRMVEEGIVGAVAAGIAEAVAVALEAAAIVVLVVAAAIAAIAKISHLAIGK
jgi:hypothetical protein